MKNTRALLLLVTFLAISCKKEENNFSLNYEGGSYYELTKYTLDGAEQTISDFVSIQFLTESTGTMFNHAYFYTGQEADGASHFKYVVYNRRKNIRFIFESGLKEDFEMNAGMFGSTTKKLELTNENRVYLFELKQ